VDRDDKRIWTRKVKCEYDMSDKCRLAGSEVYIGSIAGRAGYQLTLVVPAVVWLRLTLTPFPPELEVHLPS
jgi:hypothetical protein